MVRISEFQIKDIVNIGDGKRLGNMVDLIINPQAGSIEAIIVSNGSRMLGIFGKDEEIIIPWKKIKKVGEDVILVEHSFAFKESLDD
ncbi:MULTISPECIES: YlmC/YmxH family sporulation protein [Bacillaceae]|uniref:YlmC/YmxH family sporulation protein n=1 Tax=Peribacillus huizhouensis TaxID=1501239 RepID=A0ABR6CJS1_9BACI|nr:MULTISPECIES: YlmC/YmxH family sporulation protein [Bacillaceae]MBA9024951.1 YlmC/YmxH family sporulation protein [Peribacillus huizhouensis]